MVQISTSVAVAFLGATVAAFPHTSAPKANLVQKRLSDKWIQVYDEDPASKPDTRTQKLYIDIDKCITLENMWDKQASFIALGPGIKECYFYINDVCKQEFDFHIADLEAIPVPLWANFNGYETEASEPYEVSAQNRAVDNNIGSYKCSVFSN